MSGSEAEREKERIVNGKHLEAALARGKKEREEVRETRRQGEREREGEREGVKREEERGGESVGVEEEERGGEREDDEWEVVDEVAAGQAVSIS